MLSRLRLGPKLLLAPAVVLILLIALSSGAYYALVQQNQSLENIVQQRAGRTKAATDLVISANRAHTEIYQLLTWINASFSQARLDALVLKIQAHHVGLDKRYNELLAATQPGGAERQFIEQSQAAHKVYMHAISDVIELSMADRSIAANAMLKSERAFDVVALRLGELSKLEQQLSEKAYRDAEAQFKLLSILLPSVVVLSIALSLLVTMAVRNSLLREVREIGAAALGLGQGNLMVRSREYGNDEIGDTSRALDHSIRHLNTTLSTILNSAKSIDDASRDILQGSVALTSRAEAQASSIEETTASMHALAATLNQTAGNAQVANQLALCAASFAFKGGSVVERLVVAMDSIRGSSRKVGEIVGVIDALSSQTNALAMNAATEAERAGEHGLGFAAVASEVRTLAQRSAIAAQEIKTLMAEAALDIEGGTHSAGEAGSRLAEIAASVHQVGAIIDTITQASSQQVQGLSVVSNAIVQMDQMTRQNSALVEAAAAKAASLQNQALGLSRAVASFQLGDGGSHELPGAVKKNAGQGQGARLRLASSKGEVSQG
jgi:methyl-accepting chemotaxis protein